MRSTSSTVTLLLLTCVLKSLFSDARKCHMQDWSNEFNKQGQTNCVSADGYGEYYLVGIERDATDNLLGIKKAKCCNRDQTFWNLPTMCQMPNWRTSMDGTGNSWCQQGFFVRGLYRGEGNNVGSIEWAKCCKPSHHPYDWGNCYNEDVSNTFNKPGLSECSREGYFIAGFETTDEGGKLSSIKRFKCCQMWPEIKQLKTLDELKQRVMDTTMHYLGQLSTRMGFAWSGGCWSHYAGEDFQRDGDKWVSRYRSPCLGGGPHKENRLKISYGDFSYTMKDVVFGPSEIKLFGSEPGDEEFLTSYSVPRTNDRDTAYTPIINQEFRSARVIKNVKTTTWDRKFSIEAGVAYEPPSTTGGVGFSAKTGLSYEWGGSEEDSTVDEDWHILTIKETKELPPRSSVLWHAIKKPRKVTIPYTAKILPKFSVTLEGYMVWGGGVHGPNPNFHHEHRGSGDRETITYTFGDANRPFYEDLKLKVQQNVYPWQWHAMKEHSPSTKYYVDALTNEDLYVFTMTGQFEEVTEYEIQTTWNPITPIDQSSQETDQRLANKQKDEEQNKLPDLPRTKPPPPKVKTVDNSKEMKAPPVLRYADCEVF